MECENKIENVCPAPEQETSTERLASYFCHATQKTQEKYFATFSFNTFKMFYPEIYTKHSSDLKAVHKQLKSQLMTSISEDLNSLSQERKMFASLQHLGTVINQYKDKSKDSTWRPSGCPEDDIRDHIYEMKLKHKKRLEELLEEMKAENKMLEVTMFENHKEILNIKKDIDDFNSQINENFELIEGSNINRLEEELRTICEM